MKYVWLVVWSFELGFWLWNGTYDGHNHASNVSLLCDVGMAMFSLYFLLFWFKKVISARTKR